MKTFETLEERHIKRADTLAVARHRGRHPRQAAALSIVPGLGQLYNGETGKGLLFLSVTIANLVLFLMLFCTEPVVKGILHLGSGFHLSPSADLDRILRILHASPTFCVLYLALSFSFVVYAMREAYDHALELRKGKGFARFFLGLPETASWSFLGHFAFMFAGIVMLAFFATPEQPKDQATDIELVRPVDPPKSPERPKPPKPKAPEPPKPKLVEPPKREVKPPQPRKVEPPKPTPVAVAIPVKQPIASPIVQSSEPAPEPAPVAPAPPSNDTGGSPDGSGTAGAHSPGGGGGGGGDDVDFGSYLAEVQKRIKRAWFPPRGNESKSVTLKFKVRTDGSLTGAIKLVTSSGLAIVDQAAITAVKNAAPFPPLPPNAPDEVDIKFTFDYNVFNGRGGN